MAAKVDEAVVGPVAAGGEEDDEQERAVHARPVDEVGADEKGEDECGRGVGRDKEQAQPAPQAKHCACYARPVLVPGPLERDFCKRTALQQAV